MGKKIRWEQYFARKFCAQRFEIVMRVFFSEYFWKEFRARLQNNLVVPDQRNHAICYESREWQRFVAKIYAKVCRNKKTFDHYRKIVAQEEHRYVTVARKMASGSLRKLSWAELLRRYLAFDAQHLEFFNKPIWIPFPIEPVLSQAAERALRRVAGKKDAERYQYYFENIFSPDQINAITREHFDLLRMALKVKAGGHRYQLIKRHAAKYRWLSCYDINDAPWSENDFARMLAKILRQSPRAIKDELKESQAAYTKRKLAFRNILTSLSLAKRQKELFQMVHEMSFIKDERDDYRRMGSYEIQPLFKEIGRRAGLTLKEITQLTRGEMIDYLRTGALGQAKIKAVKERSTNGYVLLRKHGGSIRVFEGKTAREIIKKELGQIRTQRVTEITGTIGSAGQAKGRVQVIFTKHDLRKVELGDIMVTVTTHPDFVPAMRRCKAIVTDEGGITCHAAIVSRELKIPCVVGTKIATKVFKTGETVAVDAAAGLVRKVIQ